MLEVFRDQDQHAAGAARQQLAMDHQTGFDGFTQAHFVGQQNAWRNAVCNFTSDVQLVGDRLCAHATQAPERGLQLTAGVLERVVAQRKP